MTSRPCPTPRKTKFPSLGAASSMALKASRKWGTALRPYQCDCGSWHLTRWATYPPTTPAAIKEHP